MKKSTIVLTIIILVLALGGCAEDNDTQLVNSFLNKYYSQFTFIENEWDKIMLDLENKKDADTGGDATDTDSEDSLSFIDEFDEYLTQRCLDRLMANRYIPNFNMMDSEVDSFEIKELKIKDIGNESYLINYELKLLKGNNEETEKKEIEIRIADEEAKGKKLIDYIKGEL